MMDAAPRLVGSSGSICATALLFGSIAALWPAVRTCPFRECGSPGGGGPVFQPPLVTAWQPFITNPGSAYANIDPYPPCPEPQATGYGFSLEQAPLPRTFDPSRTAGPLFACVLVGRTGNVSDARLVGPAAGTVRKGLLRSIRRWRFSPLWWNEGPAAWQRVRLDSGPLQGVVYAPPRLD